MLRVSWLRRALRSLEAEAAYLAERNPAAAAQFVARIGDATDRLALAPGMGRPGRVDGTREWVVSGTQYIIPYRVRDDRLEVLHVLHSSRRWPKRLD